MWGSQLQPPQGHWVTQERAYMHGDGLSNVQSYIEAKGFRDPDTAGQMVQWIKALVT